MFRNVFHTGIVSVFYAQGTEPLGLWDTHQGSESGSSIALVRDDSIRSTVLEVRGRNVATTYLSCPAPHLASSLALELPFLGMLLKPSDEFFSFEVEVQDVALETRRFRASNYQDTTRVKDYICTMPLRLEPGEWNYVQLDLADLVKKVYGGTFKLVVRLTIHANCRVRRVFFSDKHLGEDELPNDLKLFIPASSTSSSSGSATTTRI